jgi:hypothetical protein
VLARVRAEILDPARMSCCADRAPAFISCTHTQVDQPPHGLDIHRRPPGERWPLHAAVPYKGGGCGLLQEARLGGAGVCRACAQGRAGVRVWEQRGGFAGGQVVWSCKRQVGEACTTAPRTCQAGSCHAAACSAWHAAPRRDPALQVRSWGAAMHASRHLSGRWCMQGVLDCTRAHGVPLRLRRHSAHPHTTPTHALLRAARWTSRRCGAPRVRSASTATAKTSGG